MIGEDADQKVDFLLCIEIGKAIVIIAQGIQQADEGIIGRGKDRERSFTLKGFHQACVGRDKGIDQDAEVIGLNGDFHNVLHFHRSQEINGRLR